MEFGHVLAIVGILFTVSFGLCSVAFLRRRRYPGQITFIAESSIGLFDAIVKNVPELAVLYKNAPVGEGLALLKGAFLNTGSKDITDSMVEEDLTIHLPDGFRWLTGKIVRTSAKTHATIDVHDETIAFQTGLFRCGEYLRFEALAEVPLEEATGGTTTRSIGGRLSSAFKITHRIADTQKVRRKVLRDTSFPAHMMRMYGSMLGILALIAIGFGVYYHVRGWPAKMNFVMSADKGQMREVKVDPRMSGTVRVKGVEDKKYSKTLLIEELFSLEGLKPKLVNDWLPLKMWLPMFVVMILGFTTALGTYLSASKAKKLHDLWGMEEADLTDHIQDDYEPKD